MSACHRRPEHGGLPPLRQPAAGRHGFDAAFRLTWLAVRHGRCVAGALAFVLAAGAAGRAADLRFVRDGVEVARLDASALRRGCRVRPSRSTIRTTSAEDVPRLPARARCWRSASARRPTRSRARTSSSARSTATPSPTTGRAARRDGRLPRLRRRGARQPARPRGFAADGTRAARPRSVLRRLGRRRAARHARLSVAVSAGRASRSSTPATLPAHRADERAPPDSPAWTRLRDLPRRVHRLPRHQRGGRQGRSRPERPAEHRRVPAGRADEGVHPRPARRSATAACRRTRTSRAAELDGLIAYFEVDATAEARPAGARPVSAAGSTGRSLGLRRGRRSTPCTASSSRIASRTCATGAPVLAVDARRRARAGAAARPRPLVVRHERGVPAAATATAPSSSTARSRAIARGRAAASSSTSCRRGAAPGFAAKARDRMLVQASRTSAHDVRRVRARWASRPTSGATTRWRPRAGSSASTAPLRLLTNNPEKVAALVARRRRRRRHGAARAARRRRTTATTSRPSRRRGTRSARPAGALPPAAPPEPVEAFAPHAAPRRAPLPSRSRRISCPSRDREPAWFRLHLYVDVDARARSGSCSRTAGRTRRVPVLVRVQPRRCSSASLLARPTAPRASGTRRSARIVAHGAGAVALPHVLDATDADVPPDAAAVALLAAHVDGAGARVLAVGERRRGRGPARGGARGARRRRRAARRARRLTAWRDGPPARSPSAWPRSQLSCATPSRRRRSTWVDDAAALAARRRDRRRQLGGARAVPRATSSPSASGCDARFVPLGAFTPPGRVPAGDAPRRRLAGALAERAAGARARGGGGVRLLTADRADAPSGRRATTVDRARRGRARRPLRRRGRVRDARACRRAADGIRRSATAWRGRSPAHGGSRGGCPRSTRSASSRALARAATPTSDSTRHGSIATSRSSPRVATASSRRTCATSSSRASSDPRRPCGTSSTSRTDRSSRRSRRRRRSSRSRGPRRRARTALLDRLERMLDPERHRLVRLVATLPGPARDPRARGAAERAPPRLDRRARRRPGGVAGARARGAALRRRRVRPCGGSPTSPGPRSRRSSRAAVAPP